MKTLYIYLAFILLSGLGSPIAVMAQNSGYFIERIISSDPTYFGYAYQAADLSAHGDLPFGNRVRPGKTEEHQVDGDKKLHIKTTFHSYNDFGLLLRDSVMQDGFFSSKTVYTYDSLPEALLVLAYNYPYQFATDVKTYDYVNNSYISGWKHNVYDTKFPYFLLSTGSISSYEVGNDKVQRIVMGYERFFYELDSLGRLKAGLFSYTSSNFNDGNFAGSYVNGAPSIIFTLQYPSDLSKWPNRIAHPNANSDLEQNYIDSLTFTDDGHILFFTNVSRTRKDTSQPWKQYNSYLVDNLYYTNDSSVWKINALHYVPKEHYDYLTHQYVVDSIVLNYSQLTETSLTRRGNYQVRRQLGPGYFSFMQRDPQRVSGEFLDLFGYEEYENNHYLGWKPVYTQDGVLLRDSSGNQKIVRYYSDMHRYSPGKTPQFVAPPFKVTVFPNPIEVGQRLQVSVEGNVAPVKAVLINLLGRTVREENFVSNEIASLFTDDLQSGLYRLIVFHEQGQSNYSVILRR